jgi:hypothetical protein
MVPPKFRFKFLFFSYTIIFGLPFWAIGGILSLFHVVPLMVNDKPMYGVGAFFLCLLFGLLFGFVFAGINYIILNLGRRLYGSFFREKNVDDVLRRV